MKAPGRLQRLGIGLILIGAYGAVGLNVYWREKAVYEAPHWYPEPKKTNVWSESNYGQKNTRLPRSKSWERHQRRATDTNQVWVQRPKMRFPKNSVGLNTVDSLELARWGVSTGALQHFLRERTRWRGFVNLDQLPASVRAWPVLWELDSLPPRRVLNRLSEQKLAQHPLVGWDRARALNRYRRSVRPVRSWDELRAVPHWSDANFQRLRLYFVLNQKDSLSLHP